MRGSSRLVMSLSRSALSGVLVTLAVAVMPARGAPHDDGARNGSSDVRPVTVRDDGDLGLPRSRRGPLFILEVRGLVPDSCTEACASLWQ